MYSLYYFPFRKHGGISIYIDLKKKKKNQRQKWRFRWKIKRRFLRHVKLLILCACVKCQMQFRYTDLYHEVFYAHIQKSKVKTRYIQLKRYILITFYSEVFKSIPHICSWEWPRVAYQNYGTIRIKSRNPVNCVIVRPYCDQSGTKAVKRSKLIIFWYSR